MKRLITGMLFLFFTQWSFAQELTQTIRGKITEKFTGSPIPGAGIKILDIEPAKTTTTNEEGEFRFDDIPVGRHSLLIIATGYNPLTLNNVNLSSGKELVFNIEMEETVIEAEEVVIVGETEKEKPNNEMATVSARQFSFDETSRYAGNINDVARMAQSYAGVQGADDSRNDIIVRGNSPIGVLYRFEGIDIPNPNHFAVAGTTGGPVSMLNNNMMTNSDFMTSAFPSEYGNAMSAVFDLKMRNGNNEKHEFVGQFGFNGAELLAEGPFSKKSKASYLISYRYSTLELFKLLGIEFGSTAIPKYQDLSFKFNFPYKNGSFSVFGLGGKSSVELLNRDIDTSNNLYAQEGEDLYFRSLVGVLGISNNYLINSSSYIRTTLAITTHDTRIVNDSISSSTKEPFPFYRNKSNEGKISFVILYNKKLNAKHLFRAGCYTDRLFFNLSDSIYQASMNDFVTLSEFDGNAFLIQPYTQWQYRPDNNLTFNIGIHALYFELNNKASVEPRAGVRYSFGNGNALSLGYGMHSQVPPSEIYFTQLRMSDGSYERVNKDLGFTKAHHFVLGYDKSLGNKLRLKAETYYQQLYNVPVDVQKNSYSLLNQGANFGIGFPDSMQNTGTGYNYGAELTFEKFFSNSYYYLLTLSVFNSKYKGSDGIEHNTAFNGNYMVNILGGKEFYLDKKDADGKRGSRNVFTMDVRFTCNGGQRYTPVDETLSQFYNYEIRDDKNAYSLQYPAYLRIDFKIGYKRNGKRITQQWSVDLRNVTNQQNVFSRKYDIASNSYRTTYQTGFIPVMQYRIEF